MNHPVYWFLAPLLSAVFGYLLWQHVRAMRELARALEDAAEITALFDGNGMRLMVAAKADRRILRAMKDPTQLAINTAVLYHAIQRGYQQAMWIFVLCILGIATASVVLVNAGLMALVILIALPVWLLPFSAFAQGRVHRNLAALAYSLKLWYEYDAEICQTVINMNSRFEPLFNYVKTHFVEKKHAL
jgi:hypothetical protein